MKKNLRFFSINLKILYFTKFIIKKIKEIDIVKLNAKYTNLFLPVSIIRNLSAKTAIVIQTPSCIGKYELKI